MGRSEFAINDDRLRGAVDGVLASLPGSSRSSTAGEVVVPLIGFHMPAEEIELDGVRIVRADSIDDLPTDAVDATRSGRHGRPGFVAVLSCGTAPVAPAAAVADDLRRALRAMRLFKAGAVGVCSPRLGASRRWLGALRHRCLAPEARRLPPDRQRGRRARSSSPDA